VPEVTEQLLAGDISPWAQSANKRNAFRTQHPALHGNKTTDYVKKMTRY
jgi:hypothetical protein